MTADLRLGRPSGEDNGRPDLVNLVDINRPKPATFGTIAAPDFLHPAFEQVGRDVFGDAQDVGVPLTFAVAEHLSARACAAHDDG